MISSKVNLNADQEEVNYLYLIKRCLIKFAQWQLKLVKIIRLNNFKSINKLPQDKNSVAELNDKSRNGIKRTNTTNVYTRRDMVTQSKLHGKLECN